MRRIVAVDFYKGLAILFVIFFHGMAFNVVEDLGHTQEQMGTLVVILSYPLGILGTWGGLFFMMSGIINSYNVYINLQVKKKSIPKVIQGVVINNVIMLVIHYFYAIFLSNDTGGNFDFDSFITGSVVNAAFTPFSTELLFFNNALTAIGLNGMITGFFLILVYKLSGNKFTRTTYWILAGVGGIILFATPFIFSALYPYVNLHNTEGTLIESGNYLLATLISWLVSPRFPILPMLLYSLYGAIFGICLGKGESWKFIQNLGVVFGSFYFGLGIISMIGGAFFGLDTISIFFGVPDYTVLHINDIPLNLINLGGNIIVLALGFWGFHYRREDKRTPDSRKTRGIRRFGIFTLTIFLLDPLIGAIVGRIFQLFVPEVVFRHVYFGVFVYTPVLLLIWWAIFHFWEKINYKYTFEWILGKLIGILRGYKSDRFDFKESIYDPTGIHIDTEKTSVQ